MEDGLGKEELFRTVRIPFRVAVVTGNLKLRMHVTQSWPDGSVSALVTGKAHSYTFIIS